MIGWTFIYFKFLLQIILIGYLDTSLNIFSMSVYLHHHHSQHQISIRERKNCKFKLSNICECLLLTYLHNFFLMIFWNYEVFTKFSDFFFRFQNCSRCPFHTNFPINSLATTNFHPFNTRLKKNVRPVKIRWPGWLIWATLAIWIRYYRHCLPRKNCVIFSSLATSLVHFIPVNPV